MSRRRRADRKLAKALLGYREAFCDLLERGPGHALMAYIRERREDVQASRSLTATRGPHGLMTLK